MGFLVQVQLLFLAEQPVNEAGDFLLAHQRARVHDRCAHQPKRTTAALMLGQPIPQVPISTSRVPVRRRPPRTQASALSTVSSAATGDRVRVGEAMLPIKIARAAAKGVGHSYCASSAVIAASLGVQA